VISSLVISDSPLRQHYCHTEVLSRVFMTQLQMLYSNLQGTSCYQYNWEFSC